MKHLKIFETYLDLNTQINTFKKNDTVVCNRNDLILAKEDKEKPEYGEYYTITKIDSSKQYLLIKSIKTNNILGYWSYTCFTPDYEWESQKYNL